MTRFDLETLAFQWVPCTYCGAETLTWCRTKSGRRASQLHGLRLYPVHMAYGQGYDDASYDYRARAAS